MTNILSVESISKTYGEKVLLRDVSFGIDAGQRVGLIGVNGTGKSTLLKMLAGLEFPESGTITLNGRANVHYLPQEPAFQTGTTVLEEVFQGDAAEMILLRQYEDVLNLLSQHPNSREYQDQLLSLQTKLDNLGAWHLEHEAKSILSRLGITDFQAIVSTLSGGQRKRIALARALIQPSELLILDEPTNHIDDESAVWLENYLLQRKGALFMVTHDRYFLDRIVNRIFELDNGKLYQYPGNYAKFIEVKVEREAQERASEEKRQNFLRNELQWIQRGPRARGTKQKARTEQYYKVLEEEPTDNGPGLELSSVSSRLGKTVIELNSVTMGYGNGPLINDFSYIVLKDDRVGIVGPNGMGKSTLLKLMAERLTPDSGSVKTGATVKIGYFAQEHEDFDNEQRVIDYIRDEAEYVETADGETISAAQMLERFLFPGPLQWTPIGKLSGGERRRLVLLRILMSAPNVLLLDEPTNDLDIPTLSVLESYLEDFAGAVIAVSHDRYFLDKVATKIFSFDGNGAISQYYGNFSDFVERQQAEERTVETGGDTGASDDRERNNAISHSNRNTMKFTYKEQKEYDEIEDKVAEMETALDEVNQRMAEAGGDYGKVQELYHKQQGLEASLNALLERWTYLQERAEEIERSRQLERDGRV